MIPMEPTPFTIRFPDETLADLRERLDRVHLASTLLITDEVTLLGPGADLFAVDGGGTMGVFRILNERTVDGEVIVLPVPAHPVAEDFEGQARPFGPQSDIGFDEFVPTALSELRLMLSPLPITPLGAPTSFAATVSAGATPITFTWDFGDGAFAATELLAALDIEKHCTPAQLALAWVMRHKAVASVVLSAHDGPAERAAWCARRATDTRGCGTA
jgi:hypothetical protein